MGIGLASKFTHYFRLFQLRSNFIIRTVWKNTTKIILVKEFGAFSPLLIVAARLGICKSLRLCLVFLNEVDILQIKNRVTI
jgi:hypothetical protein